MLLFNTLKVASTTQTPSASEPRTTPTPVPFYQTDACTVLPEPHMYQSGTCITATPCRSDARIRATHVPATPLLCQVQAGRLTCRPSPSPQTMPCTKRQPLRVGFLFLHLFGKTAVTVPSPIRDDGSTDSAKSTPYSQLSPARQGSNLQLRAGFVHVPKR